MTTAARREPPNHNTLTCYKNYNCRLPACIERHRAYARNIARRQAYGTWQPYVDAEPVRQHILWLREAKVTLARIRELTKLSSPTINGILYDLGPNRPRRRYLRPENAAKILAITPEHATPALIDATGTRRRIHALQVVGWPKQTIAAGIGMSIHTAGRITRQDTVRSATAHAIAALYHRLKVQVPEDHGITPWIADRTRRQAATQGWYGPLAWDGNIDDPTAEPDTTGAITQHVIHKRDNLRNEEIKHLAGFGLSNHHIARKVGLDPDDIKGRLAKWAKEEAAEHARRKHQAVAA